jgi:hypothetical protein
VLSYRINGPFVEIDLGDEYTPTEFQNLFRAIREDPGFPPEPLLVLDARARMSSPPAHELQSRLAALREFLNTGPAPVMAIVVSSVLGASVHVAHHEAVDKGIRIGFFPDLEGARRWLSAYATPRDEK